MIEFQITDAPDQQFSASLNGRRTTIRLRYNATSDRWSFNLSVDDEPVLYGQRIVIGVDLLSSYGFDIGMLFAWPMKEGALPDRTSLPAGLVRLYHATEDDFA